MEDARVHRRRAQRRETWAGLCMLAAAGSALAAPAVALAWLGVAFALVTTAATLGLLLSGRARRARTTVAATAVGLIVAQIVHSTLVLTDPGGFVRAALLLVAVPLPLLVAAYVLAIGAADARHLAWGRGYQERAGHTPQRAEPTLEWSAPRPT